MRLDIARFMGIIGVVVLLAWQMEKNVSSHHVQEYEGFLSVACRQDYVEYPMTSSLAGGPPVTNTVQVSYFEITNECNSGIVLTINELYGYEFGESIFHSKETTVSTTVGFSVGSNTWGNLSLSGTKTVVNDWQHTLTAQDYRESTIGLEGGLQPGKKILGTWFIDKKTGTYHRHEYTFFSGYFGTESGMPGCTNWTYKSGNLGVGTSTAGGEGHDNLHYTVDVTDLPCD